MDSMMVLMAILIITHQTRGVSLFIQACRKRLLCQNPNQSLYSRIFLRYGVRYGLHGHLQLELNFLPFHDVNGGFTPEIRKGDSFMFICLVMVTRLDRNSNPWSRRTECKMVKVVPGINWESKGEFQAWEVSNKGPRWAEKGLRLLLGTVWKVLFVLWVWVNWDHLKMLSDMVLMCPKQFSSNETTMIGLLMVATPLMRHI